ncbi:MAG: SpoIIE family protein phosphatase [Bauldia sp.]|nr:SpoIIE family protein phosphatase [Bauldia sp.]
MSPAAPGTAASAVEPPIDFPTVEFLKRHASFTSLDLTELEAVVRSSPVEAFDAGATVITQGDSGRCAYLVLEGNLSVEVDTGMGLVKVAALSAGDMVGEIAAFAAVNRTASVHAVSAARLLRLDQETIRTLLTGNPAAAMAITAELGRRLEQQNGVIATLVQAAGALAEGAFEPTMLASLKDKASRLAHLAELFETMASEIAAKRAFNQEMDTAAAIQRSLLPAPFDPATAGGRCDAFGRMIPARQVGGDFYDYFYVTPDVIAIAVGDVSGKGVAAAMFMSVSRTMLRTICSESASPSTILGKMNNLLARDNSEAMFVTVVLALVDLATGAVKMGAAGHDEAYFLPADGAPIRIAHMGPAIGLFEDATYPERTLAMKPGDALLLATDGVTEAFNTENAAFGQERLEEFLRYRRPKSAQGMVDGIVAEVDAFAAGAPRSDDTTVLAMTLNG